MLNQQQITDLSLILNIPKKGIHYIDRTRESEPAKSDDLGNSNNVFCRFPSKKMGHTIQARSHTFLLPVLYQYEYDDDVLEYWDKPEPIKINYFTKSGRKTANYDQPDHLVVYKDRVVLVKWLTDKDMAYRVENSPEVYTEIDGVCCSPVLEDAAKAYGFEYEIHVESEINPIVSRNLQYLDTYFKKQIEVTDAVRSELIAQIEQQQGITLLDLINKTDIATVDDINALIADQSIFVDLELMPLAEPAQVHLFSDSETSKAYSLASKTHFSSIYDVPAFVDVEPGSKFMWDGREWKILNIGGSHITLLDPENQIIELPNGKLETLIDNGRVHNIPRSIQKPPFHEEGLEILKSASPESLKKGLERLKIVNGELDGSHYSKRTIRGWKRDAKNSVQMYGAELIGLLDQNHRKGNYDSRLAIATKERMEEFIETNYEIPIQPTIHSTYIKFMAVCEQEGFVCPSEKTFREAIKKRETYNKTRKRQGSRAAYDDEPFYFTLDYRTPPHGDFPLHITHIDHTELELEIVDSETGENLGRLWLTIAIDAYSRRILAYYLSFFPPSYISCMMVLREVVRRFNRFPHTVIIDRGPDFKSVYMETLLALFNCTLKRRPKAKSRFGSVVERVFDTGQNQFIHNLRGRTYGQKGTRLTTNEVDPKRLAVWAFRDFDPKSRKYFYEIYDKAIHSTLSMSPRDKFELGLNLTGERRHEIIGFTEDFHILTCPTTRKGTAKVQKNRGVKILHVYYWCDAFRHPEVERTNVPVRYDPDNRGIAYAYVKGVWRRLHSSYYDIFSGKTNRELEYASKELQKRKENAGKNKSITDSELATFLLELEDEEGMLEIRRKQTQMSMKDNQNIDDPQEISNHQTPKKPSIDLDDEDFSDLESFGEF